jgi:curved DNA-binding protein CbpA
MSTVNLYDVLNIQQDATKQQIKDAYRKLVKEFHPDKEGGNEEMFELVTHAYNILVDPQQRAEYDELFKITKQSSMDHVKLKEQAKGYYKAQEGEVHKISDDDRKKTFKTVFSDMDKKHGYKRDDDDKKITSKSATTLLRDLELARQQEDIENIHDRIFADGFDTAKFNAAFDAMHKSNGELIKHSGNPDAWNSTSDQFGASFSSINNYEDIYAEDENIGNTVYGSVKIDNTKKKKITKSDIEKIQSADYTKGHNYKGDEYLKSIEEKLKERELEDEKYKNREFTDYSADSYGGYGIFENLGLKNAGSLTWAEDEDDIKTRYNRLLELRRNNEDLNKK